MFYGRQVSRFFVWGTVVTRHATNTKNGCVGDTEGKGLACTILLILMETSVSLVTLNAPRDKTNINCWTQSHLTYSPMLSLYTYVPSRHFDFFLVPDLTLIMIWSGWGCPPEEDGDFLLHTSFLPTLTFWSSSVVSKPSIEGFFSPLKSTGR